MKTFKEIEAQLTEEFDILEFEIQTLERVLYENRFFGHSSNFPNAHYGYLMTCMGKIDVLSAYWSGQVTSQGQTQRMSDFMNLYLYPGKMQEHRVVVQMFRHTLMHTGALRFLYDKTANIKYTWRVHFGRSLPPGMHYTITKEDPQYQDQIMALKTKSGKNTNVVIALNIAVTLLATDLKRALVGYLGDLGNNHQLMSNFHNAAPKILLQEFSS